MDWVDVYRDGGRWRAVVDTVMNRQVLQNAANSFISREIPEVGPVLWIHFIILMTVLANSLTCMLLPVNGDMSDVELWDITK